MLRMIVPTPIGPRRLHGLTLIEVLVALVIIGGSVTTMLVAQSNCLGGLKGSQLELTAQHLAKELMANWKIDKEDFHSDASGSISNRRGWTWQRTARRIQVTDSATATEVTLHLEFDTGMRRTAAWRRGFVWLIDDSANQKGL